MEPPRKIAVILFLALPSLVLSVFHSGCGRAEDPWKDVPGGAKRVLVSFPPLYCFAKQVAGPHAKVLCLAVTVGPHHFEPTTDDALKASKADLILYNGLGLDDEKIKRLASSAGKRPDVRGVGPEALKHAEREIFHAEKTKHGDHWHAAGTDPHVWLGLDEAAGMVRVICRALQRVDAVNNDDYEKRAEAYLARLKALRAEGQKKLAGRKGKIVTTHDSLRYFARNFELTILGNIQIQPGIEADLSRLPELVELCGKHHPERVVITTEPQYPPQSAKSLEKELRRKGGNVAVAEVDTLETADADKLLRDPANPEADYYLEVMRRNIDNLAKALE